MFTLGKALRSVRGSVCAGVYSFKHQDHSEDGEDYICLLPIAIDDQYN